MSTPKINIINKNANKYNTPIYNQLMLLFRNVAMQMFKWEGLPEEIEPYLIERILFDRGALIFFESGGHYFVAQAQLQGDLNMYGESLTAKPITYNGIQFPERRIKYVGNNVNGTLSIEEPNAILIKNNDENLSTMVMILPFINRLSYIFDSIGIRGAQSRLQILFNGTPKQKAIIEKELNNLMGDTKAIKYVSDKYFADGFQTLDINVNDSVDNMWLDFDKTISYLLTFMGIDSNLATQKAERLVTGEVDSNNQVIRLWRQSMLDFRTYAVKQINKIYGLNISVRFNEEKEEQENKDNNKVNEDEEKV